MCGSGRFLVPLLQDGFAIHGVDASASMLNACRARCRSLGLHTILRRQSIERIRLNDRYGLVFIPASSLCLVTDPNLLARGLRRLHALLRPGGIFVFEAELLAGRPPAGQIRTVREVARPDGARIVFSSVGRYDAVERVQRERHRYDLIRGGRKAGTEFEDFRLRFHDPEELSRMLAAAGFRDIRMMKGYAGEPADAGDGSVIVECRVPA